MDENSYRPLLKATCKITEESDYAFAYDEITGRVKVLNITGLHILKTCNGSNTIKDITALLCGLFPKVPSARIEADTGKFIEEAAKAGLITL